MKRLLSVLTILATVTLAFAQSPEMFNYQAVMRDANGNLMTNQSVDIRIGLYDGGSLQYEETHSISTDDYGLVSLQVGQGNSTTGNFSSLDWSNIHYEMKVEVDDGSGYQNLGQSPLSSVPYALHAESVPSMQLDGLSDVNAGSPSSDQVLTWDGSNWVASTPSMDLNDLGDVSAASPSSNEVLKWNGSSWTPQADNAGSGSVWNQSGNIINYGSGRVGIGTTSPSKLLDVDGGVRFGDTIALGSAEQIYDNGANEIWTNSDLISEASNDLGQNSDPWNDLYADDANLDDIIPMSSNQVNLLGDLEVSDNLYMTSTISGSDTLFLGSLEYITDGGDAFIFGSGNFAADLQPAIDNYADLGSSSNRWDDVYATNGTIQTSDRRDKTSINNLAYGLNEVMQLRAVRFKWKDKENHGYKLGIIAQEVQEVLPEVVKTHDYKRQEDGTVKKVENERLGVYYSDIIPVLIKAIQEQQEQIEELKAQNQQIKSLRSELEELKRQIKNKK